MSRPGPAFVLAVVLVAGSTAPAAADDVQAWPDPPTVTLVRGPTWSGWDWFGAFVCGDLGMLVGSGVGVAVGFAPDEGFDPVATRVSLFGPAGAAGGVTLFASGMQHHYGSYWGALGGAYVGMGAAIGVGFLAGVGDAERGQDVGRVAAFVLPALGASVGYYLSRATYTRQVPASGALLDLGRDGVVRLSLPDVGLRRDGDDVTVSITLFGGAL